MIDIKLMGAVEQARGPIEKIALLKQQPDSAKELLKIAVDPMVRFYVTTTFTDLLNVWENGIGGPRMDEVPWWQQVMTMLSSFAERKCTGGPAQLLLGMTAKAAPTYRHVMWLARLVNKDLRCGVSASTLNKVWPGLIDDLSVMLAQPYDPEKHEMRGWWAIEPKLDGYRMTIVDGIPLSRNKKVYTSVQHILDAIGPDLLNTWVPDGEIMGASKDFDEAGGSIRRKSEQAAGAVYHVFDAVLRKDWLGTTPNFGVRRAVLEANFKDIPFVKIVPQILLNDPTPEQLFAAMREMIALGYEGAMAKDVSAPYAYDRTDSLLKLKDFVSDDVEIVDVYPGKKGKKHAHHLGGFVVKTGDTTTKVGGGYSDEQRADFWRRRDEIVKGRTIMEVQHQLPNSKNGRFRFPVFVKMRSDK